jgi:hypothetical protein
MCAVWTMGCAEMADCLLSTPRKQAGHANLVVASCVVCLLACLLPCTEAGDINICSRCFVRSSLHCHTRSMQVVGRGRIQLRLQAVAHCEACAAARAANTAQPGAPPPRGPPSTPHSRQHANARLPGECKVCETPSLHMLPCKVSSGTTSNLSVVHRASCRADQSTDHLQCSHSRRRCCNMVHFLHGCRLRCLAGGMTGQAAL